MADPRILAALRGQLGVRQLEGDALHRLETELAGLSDLVHAA